MSPIPSSTRVRALVLALVVAVLAVTAVVVTRGGDAEQVAAPAPSPSPSAVPSPPPPPAPPKPAPTDPLTGLPGAPKGTVVAVKVDNSPLARPFHRGFDKASLVYQELVEGGASRFIAVYPSATTAEVGPVRSVREADLELLAQFGKIALGSSGGNPGTLAAVARAAEQGRLLDAGYESVPSAYRKAERRKDARNFFTTPATLDRVRPGGTPVKDVGLRFGPLRPGHTPATRGSVRFSPITNVTVQYDGATGRYVVLQDGTRMRTFAPANVVVQQVKIGATRYVDVLGNPTPFSTTVGGGAVSVLRDGRQVVGTWRRSGLAGGTRLFDAAGRDINLKPGPTLVLLAPAGRRFVVG